MALVIGLTLAAPPAQAAEPTVAAPVAGPIAAAAAAKIEAMPVAAQATAAPTTTAPAGKPFFKSTRGAIALVLMGGALGYMGYSFSHDRVKSPAK